MHNPELSEQEQIRRNSLEEIKRLGFNPYPPETFPISHRTSEVIAVFEKDEMALKDVTLAGRIMSRRIMGSASFGEIQDSSGRIQIYLRRDDLCPGEDKTLYNTVFKKLLDIGDIIGIRGFAFRTQVGEISIHVNELVLLSKSIKPLPIVKEKEGKVYDAVTDAEYRYRQRYVDLIVNPESRELFRKRTQIYTSLRELFNSRGYLEVETPILQPIPGGAAARPFITHHNSLDIPLYLRIANELYLKRLIVGGYDGVYEFSKDFRNEGMDRSHNPEFTVMEIYVAYKDYRWMMDFTEEMIEKVALDLNGNTKVKVGEQVIDFKRPFKRVTMQEAIFESTGFDITDMDEPGLRSVAECLEVELDETMGKGKIIDAIFGEKAEPHMIQPTFVTDYPVEMSPLCKKHRDNPELTERFELIVNGKELCNAYTELNDPIDQLERFQDQLKLSEKGDNEAMFIDMDFVRALEYGMPPTSGMGLGMDRLVMLMTGQTSIQEVLFFPQMKPEASSGKLKVESGKEEYLDLGVPEEWVEPLKALGYTTIAKLKEVEKPGKLANDLNGYKKKNKLDLTGLSPEVVEGWIKEKKDLSEELSDLDKSIEEGKFYYDYHQREQSPSWLIKHIETLLDESKKYSNTSLMLYGALEMRNLLEQISYNLMLMSSNNEQWEAIKNTAKGKQGIRRSNAKYNSLKFKYQTFSEAIGKVANLPVKAFDYKTAQTLEEDLGDYIHTYTLDNKQIDYNSEFVQKGIVNINDALSFVKSYFIRKGNSNVFGVLRFDTLNESYKKAFEEWKMSPSQNQEDIDLVVQELQTKDPIT